MNSLRHGEAGLTLIDLLVACGGAMIAALVLTLMWGANGRFAGIVILTASVVFGILLWCAIFLWLLPSLARRRRPRDTTDTK